MVNNRVPCGVLPYVGRTMLSGISWLVVYKVSETKCLMKTIIEGAQLIQNYTPKTWSCFRGEARDIAGKVDCILKDKEDMKKETEF